MTNNGNPEIDASTVANPVVGPDGTSIKEIAAALRKVRKTKGWTLREVEEKSAGKWKAVVIGSYERCDRALSLNKAVALSKFYGVPLDELLGLAQSKSQHSLSEPRVIIDIRSLTALTKRDEYITAFKTFITHLCTKRRDWNGEVISLRRQDISLLGLLFNKSEAEVYQWTIDNGLLLGIGKD